MKWIPNELHFHKSMNIKENWENSDIIDKFILLGKGVNVIIPTDQYNKKYVYILTDTIVLGQFNESHEVWLLDVTQYKKL